MKAAVFKSYGPPEVLRIAEIEKPSIPEGQEDRVIVKVSHAAVNPGDSLFRRGHPAARLVMGLFKPKRQTLGGDFAGTVEEIGKGVTKFKVGDAVFGVGQGSCAEYVRVREASITLKPKNLTFEQAAGIPIVAMTALQALRDLAGIKEGHKVLIYGASGGIGHVAVQLARYFEAEVTAVCSTTNLGWVKDLGAHHMIDYTREDFRTNGQKYDIILDTVGKTTYFNSRGSLTKTGVYVTEQFMTPAFQPLQLLFAKMTGDKRARTHIAKANAKDFDFLRELIEGGKLSPVIERCYTLEQIVEAHRHIERGHTRGKVVIAVAS